jgi:plastocyanin
VKPTQYLGAALLFMWGCQVLPAATRTGEVKNIVLRDDVTAQEIAVNPGDEIRWINEQTRIVQIVFSDLQPDRQLSCKNNIGGIFTPSNTARIAPNETASICFQHAGFFRYIVRMETGLTFGQINVPGLIEVSVKSGEGAGPAKAHASDGTESMSGLFQ